MLQNCLNSYFVNYIHELLQWSLGALQIGVFVRQLSKDSFL